MIQEKNLVFILSSSAVVTAAWIGFTLYHTAITSTITEPLAVQIQPIPPQFNVTVLNSISSRQQTPPTYDIVGVGASLPADSASPSSEVIPDVPTLTPTPEETPEEDETI